LTRKLRSYFGETHGGGDIHGETRAEKERTLNATRVAKAEKGIEDDKKMI